MNAQHKKWWHQNVTSDNNFGWNAIWLSDWWGERSYTKVFICLILLNGGFVGDYMQQQQTQNYNEFMQMDNWTGERDRNREGGER